MMNRKELTLDARFQISVKSCIGVMCILYYWPLKIISDMIYFIFSFAASMFFNYFYSYYIFCIQITV